MTKPTKLTSRGWRRTVRDAWIEASPHAKFSGGPGYTTPRIEALLTALFTPAQKVALRGQAAKALLTDKEAQGSWPQRLKALVLICGPVRWHYPDHPSPAAELAGWDLISYPGNEMTCWEASFVAAPYGGRLGLAHIYREGGP